MKINLYASPFFLFPCAPFPALNVSKRYQAFFSLKAKISLLQPLRGNVSDGNEKYIFPDGKGQVTWDSLPLWHTIKKSLEIVHIAPGPVSSFSNFTLIPRSALHFSFHKSHSQPEWTLKGFISCSSLLIYPPETSFLSYLGSTWQHE